MFVMAQDRGLNANRIPQEIDRLLRLAADFADCERRFHLMVSARFI